MTRSLVISGGGAKGAHSCGVIQYLLGDLAIRYDSLHGVSVGAINASFLAQFPHGEEKKSADLMKEMWLSLNNDKIYMKWPVWGKLAAAWRKSIFKSSPLQDLIRNNISLDKIRSSGKKIYVGAVAIHSGKYTVFDQTSDHFIDAVLASSAFPGALEPVEIMGQLWFDGGIKSISPIQSAIESGADEIDIIVTSPEKRIPKFIKNPNIIDLFRRAIDLSMDKILSNDITLAFMHNKLALAGYSDKKIVKLNIIRPEHNLIEDMLDFSPAKIKEMIDIGYNDAKRLYQL